jgi:hypothetical protein
MLCAGGGLLITAGTLLTIYESVRRPQTINITREFEERIASGKITTLRIGGGRSGLVLVGDRRSSVSRGRYNDGTDGIAAQPSSVLLLLSFGSPASP